MAEYFIWPKLYLLWIRNVQAFYIIGHIFKVSSVFCLIVASFERYWMTKHWTFTGFEYRKRWVLLTCVIFVAIFIKIITSMVCLSKKLKIIVSFLKEIVIISNPECNTVFSRHAVGQLNKSWLIGFLNMLTIFLPFVTLIFLNGGIVLMLRQQNIQQLRSLMQELTVGRDFMKERRRNLKIATNTLIAIINCYLISNLLHLFISLVEYLQPGLSILNLISFILINNNNNAYCVFYRIITNTVSI